MRRIAPLLALISGIGCAGTYLVGDEQATGAAAGTPGTGALPGSGGTHPSASGAAGTAGAPSTTECEPGQTRPLVPGNCNLCTCSESGRWVCSAPHPCPAPGSGGTGNSGGTAGDESGGLGGSGGKSGGGGSGAADTGGGGTVLGGTAGAAGGDTLSGIEGLSTGFERGEADSAGWSMMSPNPIQVTQDRAHEGEWSVASGVRVDVWDGPSRLLTPYFELDTDYLVSIWVMLSGERSGVNLSLQYQCAIGEVLSSVIYSSIVTAEADSTSWVNLSGIVRIFSQVGQCEELIVARMYVETIGTDSLSSTIFIDDFEISVAE